MRTVFGLLACNLLILILLAGSCRNKGTNAAPEVLPDNQTKTSDMVITDSAATQTTGVRVGSVYLTPDRSFLENIRLTSKLNYFARLLQEAELTETFSGEGPFTVFIPTREACSKLEKQIINKKPEDRKKYFQKLLEHHVVIGKLLKADLVHEAVMMTASGHRLQVSNQQGVVLIKNAKILTADIVCRNGVVYVVDEIIKQD